MNRVLSDSAVYSEARGKLEMEKVTVDSFSGMGKPQGITTAERGIVYLADTARDKKPPRHKDDIEFIGNVRHTALKPDDPTTVTMVLNTERLMWDELAQKFKCSTFYRMVMMRAPGQPPMIAIGSGFDATRDMRSWRVSYGAITTTGGLDIREDSRRAAEKLESRVATLESSMRPPVEPASSKIVIPPMPQAPVFGQAPVNAAPPQATASAPPKSEVVNGRRVYHNVMIAPRATPAESNTQPEATPQPQPTPRPTPTATPISDAVKRAMEPLLPDIGSPDSTPPASKSPTHKRASTAE
jgi:hypothetical protein